MGQTSKVAVCSELAPVCVFAGARALSARNWPFGAIWGPGRIAGKSTLQPHPPHHHHPPRSGAKPPYLATSRKHACRLLTPKRARSGAESGQNRFFSPNWPRGCICRHLRLSGRARPQKGRISADFAGRPALLRFHVKTPLKLNFSIFPLGPRQFPNRRAERHPGSIRAKNSI